MDVCRCADKKLWPLLALSANPLASLFAFFLASTKVPRITSLLLERVQEKAESKQARLAGREHACPGSSLHARRSPGLLGNGFPLPLGSLGGFCLGHGIQLSGDRRAQLSQCFPGFQRNHRDQGLIQG